MSKINHPPSDMPPGVVRANRPWYERVLIAVLWIIAAATVLYGLVWLAFQVSPWPSALLIRDEFDKNSRTVSAALAKYVPATVDGVLNQQYRAGDKDGYLDVFYPHGTETQRPTIVWIHGGGWISGDKSDIANYIKVLAGEGYTTIGVDYTIAPEAKYPTPVVQVNEALDYINRHAERLHVDPSRIVLAGDSAGSQIAAQVAAMTVNPAYADLLGIAPGLANDQLVGMLLNCGAYDLTLAEGDKDSAGAKLLRTFLWSYSGKKNFADDKELLKASVSDHVTKAFPPSFITAGNNDPLLPQSKEFAAKLRSLGVPVSDLFYPDDYTPALPHEYQFNLDSEAGQLALEQMLDFLAERTK